MNAKDTEARYTVASETGRLIGDIVGSPAVGARIVSSVLQLGERPSEKNIQSRLREAIHNGDLQSIKGIGPERLKRLRAALMLGKALYVDVPETGTVVDDPSVAARALCKIAWCAVETFAVLVLDVKHRIISVRTISTGTATETFAHPRDIFGTIIQAGGTRCIVAHNHPSGSLDPSAEDIYLTRQLLEAGKVLGIPVLDHLIVSGESWSSIRQTTCLWEESSD